MKKVIDNDGIEIEVASNTAVKTVNGIHYLLTPKDEAEIAAREAEWQAGAVGRTKDSKLQELSDYYNSNQVRRATFGNSVIIVNQSSKNGTTELRARLKDNVEVTECEWFFDDGTTKRLDLAGITSLNKLVIDTDQRLRKIKNMHKAAINALNDVEALSSYDVTAPIDGLSWI